MIGALTLVHVTLAHVTLCAAAACLSATLSARAAVQPPEEIAIRVGLTALVLLLALAAGPRLAAAVSASPTPAEVRAGQAQGHVQGQAEARAAEARIGWRRWIAAIVLGSIWVAAASVTAVIWLWDQRGFLPSDPRALFTAAGYVVTRVAVSLLVLAVALPLASGLDTGVELALQRARVNKNLLVLAGHAVYIVTLLVGLIVILVVWEISLVVPVTLIGVVTVALSLALQDILKNVVAGIYLLIERPFVIGDQITVGAYSGVVEDIQIRVTWLRMSDGQLALVPNAVLFTSPVVNSSYYERRRVSLMLTLPEQGLQDGATVREQILSVLEDVPSVRGEPPAVVALSRSMAGKVELRVDFWVPTGGPRAESAIVSDAIERLRLRLPEAEIATSTTSGSAAATP